MDKKLALSKAKILCSRQEKCRQDILQKLNEWGINQDDALKILSGLEKEKFIDETRFAIAFVNDKLRFNKWGKIKISYQLKLKGIPEPIIDEALAEISPENYKLILEKLLKDKYRALKNKKDENIFGKLVNFAYNKGFAYEDSSALVKKLLE